MRLLEPTFARYEGGNMKRATFFPLCTLLQPGTNSSHSYSSCLFAAHHSSTAPSNNFPSVIAPTWLNLCPAVLSISTSAIPQSSRDRYTRFQAGAISPASRALFFDASICHTAISTAGCPKYLQGSM